MLKLSENLDLPIDFVTERIAFLARTGAGKSGGMRVLFEQMFDAGQFCIFIDPKGDAWGIRAAGNKPGKPVLVMGGDHGDVPLEATAGKYIAEFLVRERVSTVLDISDFGKADMVRFITDLASTLYRRNRDVLHVFIDEADMVAGERFYDPKCLEAIQLIQNKGRHRGFGVTIATQRSAMINKSVLFASGTLIAMQTTAPKDVKVVKEWLDVVATPEVARQVTAEMPTLKTREAIFYSPQLNPLPQRITFSSFQTFDSMRTPRPGETRQQPKSLADIDLSAIERDMAETIEKVKAEDPKVLRKQIGELQKEINALRISADSQVKEVEVVREVFPAGVKNALEDALLKIYQGLGELDAASTRIHGLSDQITKQLHDAASNDGRKTATPVPARPHITQEPVNTRSHSGRNLPNHAKFVPDVTNSARTAQNLKSPSVSDLKISPTQQRILDALAFYESIGNRSPSLVQIGAVALIDPTGGHFSNVVGPLSSNGLVERSHGTMRLTDAGREYASILDAPTSLDGYHQVLRSRVRKMKSASGRTIDMLNAIIAADGQSLTNEQIGEAIGIDHTGGHFSNTIGPLSTAGLISRGNGLVTPTEVLFPEGLI